MLLLVLLLVLLLLLLLQYYSMHIWVDTHPTTNMDQCCCANLVYLNCNGCLLRKSNQDSVRLAGPGAGRAKRLSSRSTARTIYTYMAQNVWVGKEAFQGFNVQRKKFYIYPSLQVYSLENAQARIYCDRQQVSLNPPWHCLGLVQLVYLGLRGQI